MSNNIISTGHTIIAKAKQDHYYLKETTAGHDSQYATDILFEDGVWQIKMYPYKDDWNSLILHFCKNNGGEQMAREMIPMWRLPAGLIRGFTDCPRCGEDMPDSIITLWRLHNMDQIQRYHAEFGGALQEIHPS